MKIKATGTITEVARVNKNAKNMVLYECDIFTFNLK